ncbi:MAG TPA: ROK family protein [Acidimicrobiales bacterium]|nr:ROK family protein [Acidimicrobiales bacterium]
MTAAAAKVGVDVGGTKLLGVVLGPDGIADEARVPTPRGADALIEAIVSLAVSLGAGEGGQLGVGIPGLVTRSGVVRFSANLPGVVDVDVAGRVAAGVGHGRVWVENDATAALWGERRYGAAREVDDALIVTLGTGIGGAILSDGRLLRGANGFAGEFGHMTVDPDGPLCPCGRRGCWERYASGSGLGRFGEEAAAEADGGRLRQLAGGTAAAVRGEHVTSAAAEGDPAALRVLDRFGWWLALGLANLVNLTDPSVILLGGGLTGAGDVLLDPVRRHLPELMQGGPLHPAVPVLPAMLGEKAGAVGAAALAADNLGG